MLEACKCRAGGRRHGLVVMVDVLELDGWDHADLVVETSVVEPVDVLGGRDLKLVDARPGAVVTDQLGLEQRVEGLGQGVDAPIVVNS